MGGGGDGPGGRGNAPGGCPKNGMGCCCCVICPPKADVEERDATDAEATETFEEEGNSMFNFAWIGAPEMVLSLLALIAALASPSELKATNQVLVLLSTNADFG